MQEVNQILEYYHHDPSDIIAILQDVQHKYRYLPEEVLQHISSRLDVPLSRVYHLATFFRAFSLEERGRHVLHVCMGTACHVRGSPRILEALERELKVKAGKTTPDRSCTLETVNCVGACALGPVIVADEKSLGKMTPQKTERMLKQMGLGGRPAEKAAAEAPEKAAKPQAKPAAAARPASAPRPQAVPAAKKAGKGKPARGAAPRPAAVKPAGKKPAAVKKPVAARPAVAGKRAAAKPAAGKKPAAKPVARKAAPPPSKAGKKAGSGKPAAKKAPRQPARKK